ncbi:MAG TPA: hypothetical protein VI564_07860, partial [Candidatus Nanoarchaeia archaeon]|nr:hypothetical protein [Candidatus Nanoarchaeia archaeon]
MKKIIKNAREKIKYKLLDYRLNSALRKAKNERNFPIVSLRNFVSSNYYIAIAILIVAFLAITPYLARISSLPSGPIAISLDYNSGTNFDENDDGIEQTTGVVDFSLKSSLIDPELENTKLSAKWEVYSLDDGTLTTLCHGSDDGCSFIGLKSSSENWNDAFYLYYGKDGATENNIVSAMIFYFNSSESTASTPTIYYSGWLNRSATFLPEKITSIWGIEHTLNCDGCEGNKVPEQTNVEIKIRVNGNITNETFEYYYPPNLEYGENNPLQWAEFNSSHNIILWNLENVENSVERIFEFKSPFYNNGSNESNNYNFQYSIKNLSGTYDFIVVPLNNTEINLSMNITLNISTNLTLMNISNITENAAPVCNLPFVSILKNTESQINLDEYCTDAEGDKIEYSSGLAENISVNLFNSTLALTPDINFTGIRYLIITANDSINHSSYNLTLGVLDEILQKPVCTLIPNITIEKNSNFTMNLGDFCSDASNSTLYFSSYETENIEVGISGSDAIIIPIINFTGTEFMFFTVNNSKSVTVTNVFRIDVTEMSESETVIQLDAEINRPVKWQKKVKYGAEKQTAEINVPKDAFNIKVMNSKDDSVLDIEASKITVDDNGISKGLDEYETDKQIDLLNKKLKRTSDKFKKSEIQSRLSEFEDKKSSIGRARNKPFFSSIIGIFANQEEQADENKIIINESAKELLVEFETEGPEKEESFDGKTRTVKIYSDLHYENVLAYTDIPDAQAYTINIQWINNGTNVPFTNYTLLDMNSNGLPDRIEWRVPHLSNQTFEIGLQILNVQSYPIVGGNWTVSFNTLGTSNLTISAQSPTSYSEKAIDKTATFNDLDVLEIKCNSTILFNYGLGIISANVYLVNGTGQRLKINDTMGKSANIKSVFVQDYNCDNQTGYLTVRVLSQGVHIQRFDFGNLTAYANNYALSGPVFLDDTDIDFSNSALFRTNISGSGAGANVTLNYTIENTFQVYNMSGNFTSRIFNTGQNHTVFDKIAWEPLLPNSSEVVGYTSHTTAGDIAVFYRNGSFAVNLTTAALTANIGFREGGLRRYTIPAGFDYNDIIGFASRDQTTDEFVFYINGSTSADTTQADYTSDIAYANGQNTWTIPAGFNATEIIDFEINSDGTDSAVFFKNGTFIVAAAETPPLAFATVRLYTVPAGFNTRDIIGFSYHEGANDVVAFFRNGTIISDTAQLNFGSDIAFATVLNSIYPTDLNLTETTNITLQTRISNDSTTFTNWSSVYIDPSGAQTLDAQYGKFIQYRAAFYSPWEYITPFLQNVSINYTLDLLLTSINASINNTSPRIGMNINITANLSDVSGVFLCQFIDNQSLNGAKRSFNFTLSQNDGKCSQNFTISRSRGNVINFSAVGYDIYNNTNQTDFIITVANTDVGTPTILYPINQSFVSQQPLPFNVTFPGDADGDPIDITFYINGIINQTTQINTTFNASDGTYILNVSISDGFSVSQNVSINFTLDTTLPSINGSLNKSPDSIRTGNSINATFNATDNTGLDTGQILVNDTGIVRIFNFSLNGVKNAQFSQNITISCTRGCVVNITGIVNDSVNGMRQNSTVFTVGNTAPAAPTILFPTQDLYTSRQPLPINVTFPADADNDPITIRYYINGIPNGTSLVNTTFNASDGYYILNVSLFDGFDSGPNATVNFTLDTTPPSVMLVYPENATYNTSGFLQMSYTATDQLISQCQLYTNFSGVWKLNQTNLTLASGVLSFFNRTQNTEGRFAWDVFCNDTLGNSRFNSSNFTVIVDVTFPKIEFANPTPQNNSNLSSPTQIFNVTYFENNPGTLIFSLNGSLPNESMNYYNGPLNFTNLTKTGLYGTYDFYFWANDSVGRNNQTEIRTINIDTGFPRVSLEAPLNNTWNNSEPQLFTYIPTDYFTGVKNCSIVFDTGAVISTNITSGNLTGTYADFGGNYTNITGKNDNSFWFFGQVNTDGLPFVIDASANITFNASGINPSIVKSLDFDISYCHSGSAPGSIGCSGVAPSATIEVEQEVSVYNFSSGNWVLIGNLQNDADGTGGNLVNDRFNINGNLRDMVNSSNQMRLGVRSRMTSVVIGNSFLVLDYVNLTVVTSINENDIADDTTEMFSNNLDNGDYNWRVECSDYASNLNSSETRILRVDRTVPSIFNESINSTSIGINRQICLNVTVHDTISGPKYVYAEIDRPLSGLTNKSMTNDTQDPNSCGGQGGNVWSFAYTALEDGMANWTSTYAEDYAGNINSTHTFGLNWSQTASVFVNLTIMQPLFDITINESDLDVNYSFMMGCNLTCRPDSAVLCNGTYIKAQYFNNSWNDITNFSSQLFTDKLNKTCGNLAIGQSCNATFNITSSTSSGNNIFPLRCYGKGFNTPQDFSEIVPNVTINDHPTALFTSPADSQVISGFLIINASGSFDDFVVSRYQIELDDNPLFGSPSALCDTNLANCTFNTFAQTQCAEENSECYLRLNVTDNNSLKNSTFIRTEIDNIAPIIRLETPLNNTYSSIAGIDFIYTPIDGNILSCSLYNNESGTFQIMETNDTVLNNSQDVFFETLPEKNIIWNIGCNDTAANFAFNSTNFTLTIDLSNPKIDFT